ncbi:MAG: bifunctional riboflavin kinase/FAD synthetase [Ignavibacteriaceae bacterium]
MKIFHEFSEIEKNDNTFVTIGSFDGIHLGHREIINRINEKASQNGGRSFLITFDPHPRSVLSKNADVKILTTLREKSILLDALGIQNLMVIKFTKDFSQISADDFVLNYVMKSIGLKEIVIGHDHHFGKGRSGNETTLRKLGKENNFDVSIVGAYKLNDKIISSSEIRSSLINGNIKLVNTFLGRYYSFSGYVIEGDKRGRALGFPTANITLEDEQKLLPALGVYAVEFLVDGNKFFGLLSVGKRPTFYEDGKIIPEVYIYDFNRDIYGKFVTVNIVEMIRGEIKYNSAGELIEQMNKDKELGSEILSKLVG